MDPHSTPGPSSLSYYPALSPSYNERDDSAPRSQVEIPLGNIQSNRWEEGLNTRGSPFQPSHLSPLSGFEYLSNLHPVQNMPNHQSLLFDSSLLPSEGLPITHAGWRGANRQIELADSGMEYRNPLSPPEGIDGVSGLSSLPALLSTMTAVTLSSPSAESFTQSGVQDGFNDVTSFPRGQVGSSTPSLVETQGRGSSTQRQARKVKDMGRKRVQRLDDEQPFARICELLEIPLVPQETLVRRILVGVEALVEQLKHNCDLRHQLATVEADVTAERAQLLAEADTGATLRSFSGKLDKGHN